MIPKPAATAVSTIPGWRVIERLGPLRVLRVTAAAYFAAHLLRIAIFDAPEFLRPWRVSSDVSTYYAAGLRLDVGHPLYALSPGDWPVPLFPPAVSYPFLSPPFMAVLWRPLSLLPADPVMTVWWLIGGILCAATVLWTIRAGSAIAVAGVIVLAPFLASTTLSGDVNAYLVPLLFACWWSSAAGRDGAAGALASLASAIKLTPVSLAWWLLVRDRRRGFAAFVLTSAGLAGFSLLGAGLDNHLTYLTVSRSVGADALSPFSVPELLRAAGLEALAPLAIPGVAVASIAAIWALRRRPRASFAAAAVAAVFVSPVVHAVTLSLLLAAVAPAVPLPGWPRRT